MNPVAIYLGIRPPTSSVRDVLSVHTACFICRDTGYLNFDEIDEQAIPELEPCPACGLCPACDRPQGECICEDNMAGLSNPDAANAAKRLGNTGPRRLGGYIDPITVYGKRAQIWKEVAIAKGVPSIEYRLHRDRAEQELGDDADLEAYRAAYARYCDEWLATHKRGGSNGR